MKALTGARGRWSAAVAVSLALHAALLLIFSGHGRALEAEPVMTVRLVEAPRAASPAGGGKSGAEEKQAEAKSAPAPAKKQPAKTEAKPAKQAPKMKQKPAAAASETAARPGDEAKEAGAPTQTQGDGGGSGEGAGMGSGSGNASGSGAGSGGAEGGIIDASALEVLHKKLPDYPLFSRKRREEGTAMIVASIENGRVTAAEVEHSSGWERLDQSALRAVKEWRFNHEGRIRVRIPFAFRIKG